MSVNPGKVAKKARGYRHILLVMRHAKAQPMNPNGDRARELTDKGLKQAKAVAKGLKLMKLVPDVIACSAATRAQQTCAKMLKTFGDKPTVNYRQNLYDGGVQSVFDELTHAKEKTQVLMVLGHEPTVSIASQWLASEQSDPAMVDLLNLGLSTAAVVVLGSNKPFNQWQVRDADVIAVMSAKDFA